MIFGVTLERILGTGGVFFDACRLQELKKEGSGRHSEPEPLFHQFWDLLHGAQEGSRCNGSSVSTLAASGKERRLWASFWEPKAQLYSLWGLPETILGSKMGCRFKGDFLWMSMVWHDSEDVLGGW